MDKALEVFKQAQKLPATYAEPYFWVARIYHERQQLKAALSAYYEAMNHLPQDNNYYLETLLGIGLIEFTFTKNYLKSADAYAKAMKLSPKSYELYPKLMKAYNEAKEYSKADSVFELLKIAYNNKELSEDDMKYGNTAIDEYTYNGKAVSIYKYFIEPKDVTDAFYEIYLINDKNDKIERTFIVEKTFPIEAKYILCESNKSTGAHYTYPYGWKTDTVPLDDLKKAVGRILDGKMNPGAASKM